MRYVIDASVSLKWVLPEIDSDKALRLLSEAEAGFHLFLAPDVYPFEVGHSLTRAERKGIIPVGDAIVHFRKILATPPTLFDGLLLMSRAMAISSFYRVGAYDCLYVSLAEREGCELVTADDRLVKALGPHFPFILPLSSLP